MGRAWSGFPFPGLEVAGRLDEKLRTREALRKYREASRTCLVATEQYIRAGRPFTSRSLAALSVAFDRVIIDEWIWNSFFISSPESSVALRVMRDTETVEC
jgi:hypothetical protein